MGWLSELARTSGYSIGFFTAGWNRLSLRNRICFYLASWLTHGSSTLLDAEIPRVLSHDLLANVNVNSLLPPSSYFSFLIIITASESRSSTLKDYLKWMLDAWNLKKEASSLSIRIQLQIVTIMTDVATFAKANLITSALVGLSCISPDPPTYSSVLYRYCRKLPKANTGVMRHVLQRKEELSTHVHRK